MSQGVGVRPPRLVVVLAALLALVTACGSAEPVPLERAAAPSTTETTSAVPTTAPAPTTTAGPPPPAPPPSPVLPPFPAGAGGVLVTPTGVVAPLRGGGPGGWSITTPCGLAVTTGSGQPLGGAHVVLDPGHGGDERGAVGPNGLTEAELNLAVAREAARRLEAAGATVVLTRAGDYQVPLAVRAAIAEQLTPHAFVSIHHNAEPDGPREGPGSETYYQIASADSKRLAGILYEETVAALDRYDVAWVADTDAGAKYRLNSRGGDYYGILRMPAGGTSVLAELAFLSNPAEAELLARPEVQAVEAEAIVRGVLRFLTTDDPGSGFTEPYPRSSPAGPGGGDAGCADPPLD
ncbi:hypothetical protein BH24ACT3_BH24ACT3_01470 [soil metagenome]